MENGEIPKNNCNAKSLKQVIHRSLEMPTLIQDQPVLCIYNYHYILRTVFHEQSSIQ